MATSSNTYSILNGADTEMKRDNKYVLKVAGLALIFSALMMPLVLVDFSVSWISTPPIAAPTSYNGRLLDYNVIIERERILTYDNNSKTFYPSQVSQNELHDSVASYDLTIKLLFYGSFLLSLAGVSLSAFYNDKLGKILVLIGVAMAVAVVFLSSQLKSSVEAALVDSGRTASGNGYYRDITFNDGVADFKWRENSVVSLGLGYYFLIAGIVSLLIGEFIPTSKPINSEQISE